MRTLRLTIAYDGTDFRGWQVQSAGRTVQGELEAAFRSLTGEQVRIQGAGRTDSGVHALGQVASLRTDSTLPCWKIRLGLGSLAADDVAVVDVADAPEGFNARHSARGKCYRYQIVNAPAPAPLLRRYAWHIRAPLDRAAMRAAAECLVGTHDFSSFRLAGCDAQTPVREMRRLELLERGDGVLWIELEASAFLRGMARAVVGTLAAVGRGRLDAGALPGVLAARRRGAAGQTAPAPGLCLVRVHYPMDDGVAPAPGSPPPAACGPATPHATVPGTDNGGKGYDPPAGTQG